MDELEIILMAIATIMGIITAYFNTRYRQVKIALKEIVDAFEDDQITKEEFVKIVRAVKNVIQYRS